MALLGPTIAKYMDTGEFDTESIATLHQSMSIPTQPIPPIMIDESVSNDHYQLFKLHNKQTLKLQVNQ